MIDSNSAIEESKARMIRNIIRLWGVKNIDELDPLVKILIDALSGEVGKINQEMHTFEKRILDKMSLIFTPSLFGFSNISHAVAHAIPNEHTEIISLNTQLSFISKQQNDLPQGNIYFTPINDVHLFDSHVHYLFANNNLYECNGLDKFIRNKSKKNMDHIDDLWIGLKVNTIIKDLNGISFYFNCSNSKLDKLFSTYLNTSEWYFQNKKINIQNGFLEKIRQSCDASVLLDHDPMHIMEREVCQYYNDQFIVIRDLALENLDLKRNFQKYPEEFIKYFPISELELLDESILWINIKAQMHISADFFNSLIIHTNAFPVINRQLKEITYRLKNITNIIPIKTGLNEFFLSMISLIDSENHSYKKVPYVEETSSAAASFVIRREGVERMDSRNAKEYLQHVLTLIRDESSAFASYGTDVISNILKEIEQLSSKLEQRLVKSTHVKKDYSYYLLLQHLNIDQTFFLKFWITNGVIANKITAGTNLVETKGSQLKKNSIYLLTPSIGAKEVLAESNQIDAFKYAMLSHDRIVTAEDIKAFCRLEIGRYIESDIVIQKGLLVSDHPNEGLVRCVEVLLKRKKSHADATEVLDWDTELKLLQAKIEMRSSLNLRIVLKLIE